MNSELIKVLAELDQELININDQFIDEYLEWYESNIANKEFKSITELTLVVKNQVNKMLKTFDYVNKVGETIGASCFISCGKGVDLRIVSNDPDDSNIVDEIPGKANDAAFRVTTWRAGEFGSIPSDRKSYHTFVVENSGEQAGTVSSTNDAEQWPA